jgi:ABC-type transporter Mla MlaB component
VVASAEDSAAPPRATPAPRSRRQPTTIELGLAGPIERADIPALCERARMLMESSRTRSFVCDVGAVVAPDAVTIDALARLQLTALRAGRRIGLSHVSSELQELLLYCGLSGVVPLSAGSDVEARRQAEKREVCSRVQEERDPADPAP